MGHHVVIDIEPPAVLSDCTNHTSEDQIRGESKSGSKWLELTSQLHRLELVAAYLLSEFDSYEEELNRSSGIRQPTAGSDSDSLNSNSTSSDSDDSLEQQEDHGYISGQAGESERCNIKYIDENTTRKEQTSQSEELNNPIPRFSGDHILTTVQVYLSQQYLDYLQIVDKFINQIDKFYEEECSRSDDSGATSNQSRIICLLLDTFQQVKGFRHVNVKGNLIPDQMLKQLSQKIFRLVRQTFTVTATSIETISSGHRNCINVNCSLDCLTEYVVEPIQVEFRHMVDSDNLMRLNDGIATEMKCNHISRHLEACLWVPKEEKVSSSNSWVVQVVIRVQNSLDLQFHIPVNTSELLSKDLC